MALMSAVSQADQALFDTLSTKAEGFTFDRLADLAGVARLKSIPIKYWRKALQVVQWGPRGSVANTFVFVREALRGLDKSYTVTLSKTPVSFGPHTDFYGMTWVAGGAVNGFVSEDLFRLWEIGGRVYFSVALPLAPPVPWSVLLMAPLPSPYWRGANWPMDFPDGLPATTATAKKLAFVYREYDALYKLWLADEVDPVPGAYLQDIYRWGAAIGTTALPSQNNWPLVDAPGNFESNAGVTPLFAASTAQWTVKEAGTLRYLRVAADVGLAPARGGAYAVTLQVNSNDTTLSCSVGAGAEQSSDLVHSAAVSKGDLLQIKVESDANVNKPLRFPRFSVTVDRPNGEPHGGAMLPGAADAGNPAGAGPYPIYLSDDTLPTWAAALQPLLAAGVQVQAKSSTFKAPW